MSNTKILAVDLDDTLFTTDKSICQENIDALNQMLDEGHVLAIDTGRPAHVVAKLLGNYPVFSRENVYFLTFQGSCGYDAFNKKDLFGTYLDNDGAIKLLTDMVESGVSGVAFEAGQIFAFRDDENVSGYGMFAKEKVEIIDSPTDLIGHNLIKIMGINFKDHKMLHDFEDKYLEETNRYFNSMFSNVAFLEYVSKDASKGGGLLKLADYLAIPESNTVACGDERNDISMIKMAQVGCAVSNAREELKAQADYITIADNNNGAVAEVIHKFILN